jgi:hypothetical protein
MWCRSAPRPSFPRTTSELQRCFATPAALCRRRGRRGVPGRVSIDIAGRTDSAARVTDTPGPGRCRLADDDADAPRVGSTSRRRRGPRSIGPGSSFAGEPDRRPSRPAVSPTYAQGSCYGTNRVVAGAPGRFAGPAAPLLSTARAAQPPGCSPSRSRSHVVRTGRVFRKNRTRGRGDAGTRGRGDAGAGGRGGGGGRAPARHASPSRRLPRRVRLPFQSSPQPGARLGTLLDQAHHVRAHRDTSTG